MFLNNLCYVVTGESSHKNQNIGDHNEFFISLGFN